MIAMDKPNPFLVLGLPTDATRADIVARGQELYDTAETDKDALLFRWATEQLITNPRTRLEYELFELPDTQYEDDAWERFVRAHRKKPIELAKLLNDTTPPSVADMDMTALLRQFLDGLLTMDDADITKAINGSPYVLIPKLPLEVRDVIFG